MADKKVSIIIVNYRSEKFLKACLASVFDCLTGLDSEVIIVNNDQASALEKIKNYFPEIKIIENNKNVGFGAAVNQGVRMAVGEIIFILNPDTILLSHDLADVLAEFKKDEKLGLLGGRLVDSLGKTQAWIAGVEKTLGDLVRNNLGLCQSKKIWNSSEKRTSDWVSGATLFVRRDLFLALAGFDEKIFMYFEDIDLCRRVKEAGMKVLYFPKFTVRHLGGGSFLEKKEQKKYYYDSQEYYFLKHRKKWELFLIKLARKIF